MLLIDPTIRLSLGSYEAFISPAAGARLMRLVWHGEAAPVECVIPAQDAGGFDPFQWPKAGAFPMLPFTNRLRDARLGWGSEDWRVTPQPGQAHGLHGLGHRLPWEVVQANAHDLTLSLNHPQPDADWPWSFGAEMRYVLSSAGLQISMSVTNTSLVEIPVALGWHPFLPLAKPVNGSPQDVRVQACQSHDMSPDGLSRTVLARSKRDARHFILNTLAPQTIAYESWDGKLLIAATPKHNLCIASPDASHLVLHVPPGGDYICAEPVTALPGAHENYSAVQKHLYLALAPGAKRRMTCRLGIAPNP